MKRTFLFYRIWALLAFTCLFTSCSNDDDESNPTSMVEMYDMLMMLPKEYYPYIGPMLHTFPGISDRILMLPGIKETKNKFPERIAPQLQGIEDLEFLSPHLYILLIPLY